ncbi:MAG: winged helix-turn-helix domain-containing protein [Candidatus Pacearchaeota archaeon]
MDFDLFLTSPRWEILKIIAEKPSSPVEIALELNTTVSYVSQQLKLLDAANLLKKEKTGAVEKGKPRTIFSLSNELFYLTIISKKISEKRLIPINDYHKAILNIWLLKDIEYHYFIEKFFWKLEEDIEEIDAIFLDNYELKPKVIIISDSKKLRPKLEVFVKKLKKEIEYVIISKSNFKKVSKDSFFVLHDPFDILKSVKGGEDKKDG